MLKDVIKLVICISLFIIGVVSCKTQKSSTVHKILAFEDSTFTKNAQEDTPKIFAYQPARVIIPPQPIDTLKELYESAYIEFKSMLENRIPLNFKKAVFVVENTYHQGNLNYESYDKNIQLLTNLCKIWMNANRLTNYIEKDSINLLKNMSIYRVLKDTIFFLSAKDSSIKKPLTYPFEYDFEDFFGSKDWSKMFVTKLMETHSGNCHSLPYLYKILANELDATAYISLAPSHYYIKVRSRAYGWFNTELTSGDFPTDAWVTASGYISIEAIRSGIFMDTLSQKQNITLCLYDLAKGYERQRGYADDFIIRCCNLILNYYPNNINAIILKAETLKRQFGNIMRLEKAKHPLDILHKSDAKNMYQEMERLYVTALELGYREMPQRMYLEWLTSIKSHKDKYTNQKINNTFKQN